MAQPLEGPNYSELNHPNNILFPAFNNPLSPVNTNYKSPGTEVCAGTGTTTAQPTHTGQTPDQRIKIKPK